MEEVNGRGDLRAIIYLLEEGFFVVDYLLEFIRELLP